MKNLILFLLLPSAIVSQAEAADITSPDVVYILADDMGDSDLGFYGSKIPRRI